jgi:hypothetical protein
MNGCESPFPAGLALPSLIGWRPTNGMIHGAYEAESQSFAKHRPKGWVGHEQPLLLHAGGAVRLYRHASRYPL